MTPQDAGTAALGCARQLVSTHLLRHFPHCAQSLQHPSPFSSPSHSCFQSPLYMPRTVQYIALTEVTLTERWPWHLVEFGQKKRKMLGYEESPASKAVAPAPVRREATRESSMEETLKFPVGGSWPFLPEHLQQGEPMDPLHRALHTGHGHGLCWELRLQNTKK